MASQPSIYNQWPTRDAPSFYTINSLYIEYSTSQTTIERKTYSILEFLGDVGGLLDGLKLAVGFFVTPIATFALKFKLVAGSFQLSGAKDPLVT